MLNGIHKNIFAALIEIFERLFMLQPQNLVLTGEFPECDVKLCDFGISRYISHGADIREILGTPDYVGEWRIYYSFVENCEKWNWKKKNRS